jgi:hypothetical protein
LTPSFNKEPAFFTLSRSSFTDVAFIDNRFKEVTFVNKEPAFFSFFRDSF